MNFEAAVAKLYIVTPTYNSERYLESTIASILTQAGDFEIHYHIQDGGSSDSTIAIIEKWIECIASKTFPILCKKVTFTYATESDEGMYDAINKGFWALKPGASDVLTWLNSDDVFAVGAIASVLSFLDAVPDAAFVGGRMALIDAEDRLLATSSYPPVFSQAHMREGLYDGRALNFVQQEGVFWRGWLWDKVGGLDASFKLSGDWDLWRRFADHAEYYSLDAVTAFHRRWEGQLSNVLEKYYSEVDAKLDERGRYQYETMRSEIGKKGQDDAIINGKVGVLGGVPRLWTAEQRSYPHFIAPIKIEDGRVEHTFPIRVLSGLADYEGPHPEFNLPSGIRWMHGPLMTAVVEVPAAHTYSLVLCFRAIHHDLKIQIEVGSKTVVEFASHEILSINRDAIIRVPVKLNAGTNKFKVKANTLTEDRRDISHRILLLTGHVEQISPSRRELEASLEASLASLEASLNELNSYRRLWIVNKRLAKFLCSTAGLLRTLTGVMPQLCGPAQKLKRIGMEMRNLADKRSKATLL